MTEEPTTEGLVEDFLEEFRRGDVPDEDSFIAAHPKQAGELRDLLPLLVEMEDYGRERRRKDSRADETPPIPMIGIETASYTCQTIRTASGKTAGPLRPPVTLRSTGLRVFGSMRMASSVLAAFSCSAETVSVRQSI